MRCSTLAYQALKASGAKTRNGPDTPEKGDYVWGRPVYIIEATPDGPKETGKLANVQPGDIIQYRNVRFGEKGGFAHHTSVVAQVNLEHRILLIYQQNVGGKRFVAEGHPHLKALTQGWLRFYRPLVDSH